MTDYIDRQAAIDAVMILPQKWDGMFIQDLNCRLRDALNALPTAEVEPVKRGRWIYDNQFHWYRASCSKCGYKRVTDIKAEKWNDWHYCPHCGARMEPISASSENGREQRRSPDASL